MPTDGSVGRAFVNATTSGNTEIVAAQGPNIKIRAIAALLIANAAVTVKFQSATTDISCGFPLAPTTGGGFAIPHNRDGWWETNPNEALNLNLSGNVTTGCQLIWIQVV